MSSVAEILASSASKKKVIGIPGQRLNKPPKTRSQINDIGIEIELEGRNFPTGGYFDAIRAPQSGATWLVKNDGSLRGGLEYVLDGTCKETEVEYLVNGLFDVFVARQTALVPSNRCSLHVHYNVGGLRVNSITSIIALWTIFEEPLLRWWGDARYKNHFCLSSKDEGASIESWGNFLRSGRLPEEQGLRYTALNLVAIRKYGSVEFRGGGAINDPQTAITWTRFLHRLCEYAKERYTNPQQIAYDLSERGPEAILDDICGEEFAEFFQAVRHTVPEFAKCCTDSFHNIQPVILGFPWDQWLPEIDKAYVPNPFENERPKKKTTMADNIEWRHAEPAQPQAQVFRANPAIDMPRRVIAGRTYIWNVARNEYVLEG